MREFVYNAAPARILFGSGTRQRLPDEAERLGLERLLVLSTPDQEAVGRSIAEILGSRATGLFSGAVMGGATGYGMHRLRPRFERCSLRGVCVVGARESEARLGGDRDAGDRHIARRGPRCRQSILEPAARGARRGS
jgi:hypothetical protein